MVFPPCNRCFLHAVAQFGLFLAVAIQTRGAPPSVVTANRSTVAVVCPISAKVFAPNPSSKISRELIQSYDQSIRGWGKIVADRVQPVPNRRDWRYLGLSENVEDHVRPTAYTAMILGFLAEFRPPQSNDEDINREKYRELSIGLLRYLTASHVTGGGACVNGKPWGDQWQSAMWARAVGMAGWFLWPHLDEELQSSVARLVEYEADRFITQPPKSSLRNDTGAEENAWNAGITALACNMMPSHPRAKAWEEAALSYMYNTFSVAADARDAAPGDLGRPVKAWVTTVNAHDDFTVENHGLVHVGYLKNSASMLQENILPWLITGGKIPKACMHHVPEVFDLLIRCMAWDGAPVYFSGTDWKLYHEQSCEIVAYAMLSLLKSDRRAAYLEKTALPWILRQQRSEKGYYNVRRDLEYGGLCATRLIACCLAHGIADSSPEPIGAAEFGRLVSGTRHLVSSKAVVHRTPSKFASFSWSQKRMALSMPRDGTWVIWPHFASYLGILEGQDSSQRNAPLNGLRVETQPDGFRVSGTLRRCGGKLGQDFFFDSSPGDFTVYIERLRMAEGFRPKSRETGVIGLEYPLGSNERSLYGPWGTVKTTGYGGHSQVRALFGDWLNIGDAVGFVVRRGDGQKNLMRYHDESQGEGRVPQLQEWISLVGEADPSSLPHESWACVVTFLNQPSAKTKDWTSRVRFVAEGDRATCTIGEETIAVEFLPAPKESAQTISKPAPKKPNVLSPITDDPALPRILLVGDSISKGYTLPVRELLKGKANVHRPPENCGPTTLGVEKLDEWLGKGPWKIIHFNFGLHDLKYIDGKHQVPLADYEKNLREIVRRLRATGAAIVWCNTTPVPKNCNPPRRNADVIAYNAAAKKIMAETDIPIDDL
jgi:hypothetical protein